MDSPNYTWKANAEEEAVARQMAALKLQNDEKRRKQREIEIMKSNIFYPFPNQSTSQSSVPSTSQSSLPSTSKTSLPSTSKTSLPSTSQASLPSTSQASFPSTSQTSFPSTSQASFPSTSQTSFPSTSQTSFPSTYEDFSPMPSTSAMSPSEMPSCSYEYPQEKSNVLGPNNSNNPRKIIRYEVHELLSIASKMPMNIRFKRDKKPLLPGPIPFQRCVPPVPIRKNGLYRCVKGLEMPEPLNDVLNQLEEEPPRRFRMIRKTSHLRSPQATEEEELENMYNQEEP